MSSCLVLGTDLFEKIMALLEPDYICRLYSRQGSQFESIYEQFDFTCLIVYITNSNFQWVRRMIERMRRIRPFPVIAITQGLDLENARLCGTIGVDRFVDRHQLFTLKSVVSDNDIKAKVKVKLTDFAIHEGDYPIVVSKALKYIEENYITLAAISEIANTVGICEGTLSRLFKKHDLSGPKRVLMQFKIFHAINLMKMASLSLTKIAHYSGFSCEKRLNDCFNNFFNQSAKHYRDHFLLKNEPVSNVFHF